MNLHKAVTSLKHLRHQAMKEVTRLDSALHILGVKRSKTGMIATRKMSKAGREAISRAQRARWAQVKKSGRSRA